jgi:hypothetical protein
LSGRIARTEAHAAGLAAPAAAVLAYCLTLARDSIADVASD